jgi:hypothetical protein
MGGGGSKSSSSSVSGSAQKWAIPYATAGAGAVQNVFNQNQPNLQALTNQVTGKVIPGLQNQVDQSGQTAGQAQGYYGDVLSGKYLQGNHYMDQLLSRLRGDVTNGVNSQFEMAGRYGSDAHGAGLARGLGDAEGALLYQNYGDEMNRMGDAAQASQASNLGNNSQLLASLGLGAELPYTGSSSLANSLGALFNGGTSNSMQKQSGPGLLGAIGAVGAGLASNPAFGAAVFSDRRMKADIEELGDWDNKGDGLKRYAYRYKWETPGSRHEGVMADEVKELRPQAYVPNWQGSGFDAVNYAAL